jgi:hypothetical protein
MSTADVQWRGRNLLWASIQVFLGKLRKTTTVFHEAVIQNYTENLSWKYEAV